MKIRRKSLWVVLALGVVIASGLAAQELTINLVGYENQGAFWQTVERGAMQAGKDFNVSVTGAAPNQASDQGMIQLLQAAIAARPNGLVINYTGKVMEEITLKALQSKIPLVLYNNNRFEKESGGVTSDPRITGLAFVGQDEHHSGEVLGTAFLRFLPKGGGTVLVVNPFPQAFVLTLRYEGVKSVLEAHGYKTDVLIAGADEGQNKATIGAYLQAHPKIVGIVGLGTPAANPAASYLSDRNLKTPVATFDIDEGALKNIQDGHMAVALNQQPWLQGYLSVEDLILQLRYGFKPVNINTGTFIVEKSNADQVAALVKAGRS